MDSTFLTHADFWQYLSLVVLGIISLLIFLIVLLVKVFLKPAANPELKTLEQRLDQVESQLKAGEAVGNIVSQQEFVAYLTAWRKTYQSFHAAEKVFKNWQEGRQVFNESTSALAQRLLEQHKSLETTRPLLSDRVSGQISEFLVPAKKLHKN